MHELPLTLEHALLGLLQRQPMHGYELYQQLRDPGGLWLVWRIKQSQLYALLAKLEEKGYLAATLQFQATRPPRRVFALTQTGQAQFGAWMEQPVSHGRAIRQEFLAKLYFARQDGQGALRRLIATQRAECRRWQVAQATQAAALTGHDSFATLVHDFRTGQIDSILAWLDRCEQQTQACEPILTATV
jgi:PadR family transcriptional regulator, regulatory protein AphA